jgi:hypothetical protein
MYQSGKRTGATWPSGRELRRLDQRSTLYSPDGTIRCVPTPTGWALQATNFKIAWARCVQLFNPGDSSLLLSGETYVTVRADIYEFTGDAELEDPIQEAAQLRMYGPAVYSEARLYEVWTTGELDNVQQPIWFCSGWPGPVWVLVNAQFGQPAQYWLCDVYGTGVYDDDGNVRQPTEERQTLYLPGVARFEGVRLPVWAMAVKSGGGPYRGHYEAFVPTWL